MLPRTRCERGHGARAGFGGGTSGWAHSSRLARSNIQSRAPSGTRLGHDFRLGAWAGVLSPWNQELRGELLDGRRRRILPRRRPEICRTATPQNARHRARRVRSSDDGELRPYCRSHRAQRLERELVQLLGDGPGRENRPLHLALLVPAPPGPVHLGRSQHHGELVVDSILEHDAHLAHQGPAAEPAMPVHGPDEESLNPDERDGGQALGAAGRAPSGRSMTANRTPMEVRNNSKCSMRMARARRRRSAERLTVASTRGERRETTRSGVGGTA